MDKNEQVFINLDAIELEGKRIPTVFTERLCDTSHTLSTTFIAEELMNPFDKLDNGESKYKFIYKNVEWDCLAFTRKWNGDFYSYTATFLLSVVCKPVNADIKDTQSLARALHVKLTDDSYNIPFDCPMRTSYVAPFIMKTRIASFMQNWYKDRKNIPIVYVSHRGLISKRVKDLVRNEPVTVLEPGEGPRYTNEYSPRTNDAPGVPFHHSFTQSYLQNRVRLETVGHELSYNTMWEALFNTKIVLDAPVEAELGKAYQLRTGFEDLDNSPDMTLIMQEYNRAAAGDYFTLTFGGLDAG